MDRPVPEKLDMGFLFYGHEVLQVEGDIRGLPNTVRKIGKYRNTVLTKNRRNTAFMIGYIYGYPSRVLFSSGACMHYKSTSATARKRKKIPRIYRYNDRKARSLDETLISF